jgi:hypothetical protein
MKGYLTIQEAVKLTQRSDSTIRRWLSHLNSHEQKYIRRDQKRLFIEQSFLMRSFGLSDDLIVTAEVSDYTPDRHHHQPDIASLLQRQQDNIDRLLEDNIKKDAELKDAWSIITKLKEETLQLSYQLKALTDGKNTSDDKVKDYSPHLMALLIALILLMAYFIFLT